MIVGMLIVQKDKVYDALPGINQSILNQVRSLEASPLTGLRVRAHELRSSKPDSCTNFYQNFFKNTVFCAEIPLPGFVQQNWVDLSSLYQSDQSGCISWYTYSNFWPCFQLNYVDSYQFLPYMVTEIFIFTWKVYSFNKT